MHLKPNYYFFTLSILCAFFAAVGHFSLGTPVFPVDDPYIYVKQALNLLEGHLFSFSIGEPQTNSNTSFLYYIIYAFQLLIPKFLGLGLQETHTYIYWTNFTINMLFAFISVKCFVEISTLLGSNKTETHYQILAFTTTMPVVFSFISGFETGLTLALLILQTSLFLQKRYFLFVLVTIIASLNRPENLVVNMVFCTLFIVSAKELSFHKKATLAFAILISISIVPLLNLLFTVDVQTASSARADLLTIRGMLKNFLLFPSIGYTFPDWLSDETSRLFEWGRVFISLTMMVAFLPSLIFFLKRIFVNQDNILRITSDHFNLCVIVAISISYAFIPLIATSGGEWSRYYLPVLPMIYLISFQFLYKSKLIFSVLIFANLVVFPFYILSYQNITTMLSKSFGQTAHFLEAETDSNDKVAIDSAGYLSNFIKGTVIDVYGLGTARYTGIHGNFSAVYDQLRVDKPNFIVTWETTKPTFYLDSAHYSKAFGKQNLIERHRSKMVFYSNFLSSFPKHLVVYEVFYKK